MKIRDRLSSLRRPTLFDIFYLLKPLSYLLNKMEISQKSNSSSSEYIQALERIFNLASERYSSFRSLPTIASPQSLTRGIQVLENRLPDHGWGLTKTVDYLFKEVLPTLAEGQVGSRYFGFVTGGANTSATLADFLTTIFDQNVQVHLPVSR